ncbi:ComEC/Rec2 family competence protein [Cloacibacterium rupense]|nr:ComEC/Rec2 family competence protein [Cloacibacterium rupense]
MNKQPLLLMLLCYVLGILFCDLIPTSIHQTLFLMSFALVFKMLSFFKVKILKELKNYSLGFLFFSVGVFSHYWHSKKPEIPNFQGKQTLVFQIDKKLNSNKKYRKYEVLAKVEKNEINAILYVPKEEKQLDFKNYYQTKVYINKVESPKNDFQFDYAKYLSRKGIYYQSFATEEILEAPKKTLTISEKIRQKRLEILNTIDGSKLPKREREFLKGIILADRTEMDAEMVSDFSKSGLVHFLAISGTHLAIIFWLILYLLKPIFPAKFRRIPIVLSLLFIWSFTIFIDYGSSVVRSCLMITAYYSFVLLQRKPDLLHAIAIAGFAILIFDTHQLFDVGFQLSFVAVFGIFWLNTPILKNLPRPKNKIQDFLFNIVSMSLAAQMATLPLVIFYFHQYSFLSIVANVIIVPFSEIIIIFSLLMTVLFAFKIEFSWLSFIYEKLVDFLLNSIHFFAEQDWFFHKNIPLNIVEIIILFVVIFLLRGLFLHQSKALPRVLGFAMLFLLVRIFINFYQFNRTENLFLEHFNQKIVIQKEGGKAIFRVSETADVEVLKRFIIDSYMASRRVEQYEVEMVTDDFLEAKMGEKFKR